MNRPQNNNHAGYYAIIPANVRYDPTLSANAKLLYGEITALCKKEGFCWSSNGYFARLYGKSKETISRWIAQLIRSGYVESTVDKNDKNKRHISLVAAKPSSAEQPDSPPDDKPAPIDKNVNTLLTKTSNPIDKNVKHNNTSNNTSKLKTFRPNPSKPATPQSKKHKKTTLSPESTEFGLSKMLFDEIYKRKPDYKKPDLQRWAVHIGRMIRIDKRGPPRIKAVIMWCQQDAFWQNNILSTDKLRQQFDQLELKMREKKNGKNQRNSSHNYQSQHGTTVEG